MGKFGIKSLNCFEVPFSGAKFCKMLLNDGELEGKRILSQSSIDIMTEKHSERTDGFYNAFSLFVLEDPAKDGRNSSKGIYGWSGYHNTHFWIDNIFLFLFEIFQFIVNELTEL